MALFSTPDAMDVPSKAMEREKSHRDLTNLKSAAQLQKRSGTQV